MRTFARHDYRVAVDISCEHVPKNSCHSVGLLDLGEGYCEARSNWIPPALYGAFTLRQVYEDFYVPTDRPSIRYPFTDSNITALPPAA